ncbi:MAG: hypothetical protein PUI05_01835 [Peptoniphilaceae bacterium]|nr:hypothetical protein [Peptoniphilaceae bacterium]
MIWKLFLLREKNDKNVVMLSLEEYDNLIENAYIMKDSDYYKDLVARVKDIEEGKLLARDIIEG